MTSSITIVVSYDLGINRLRRKAEKQLKRYGVRVLESVFECKISPDKLPALKRDLQSCIKTPTDGIRIYKLCAECAVPLAILGVPSEETLDPVLVI